MNRTSDSPADNDAGGQISFKMENDNNEQFLAGFISVLATDVSDGSEGSSMYFGTMNSGSLSNAVIIDSRSLNVSNDVIVSGSIEQMMIFRWYSPYSASYRININIKQVVGYC